MDIPTLIARLDEKAAILNADCDCGTCQQCQDGLLLCAASKALHADATIAACIHVLRGNFGAGRGQEALDQHKADIAALEAMRDAPATAAGGVSALRETVVTQADREAACAYLSEIAGLRGKDAVTGIRDDHPALLAFAHHRLAERERCAKVAENLKVGDIDHEAAVWSDACQTVADAIRETSDVE